MKIKSIAVLGLAILVVGCAGSSAEYYAAIQHANEQRAAVELAKAEAESARMEALKSFAYSDDAAARSAAVMGITFAGNQNDSKNNGSTGMVMPRQPESTGDTVLKWASVLVPSLTNLYGINRNSAVQMKQIDADREMSIHDNDTMLGFGRLAADKEAPIVNDQGDGVIYPIVGDNEDELIFPEPTPEPTPEQ